MKLRKADTHNSEINSFITGLHKPGEKPNRDPVTLTPLDSNHIEQLLKVGFQPEIWRYARYPKNTPESFKRYFDKVIARKDGVNFAIVESASGSIIGFTRLKSVDYVARKAEMGTWLISNSQSRGYNYYIKKALLAVAFDYLKLDLVYCYVNPENLPSIKSLNKLGFQQLTQFNRVSLNSFGDAVYQLYFCFTRNEYHQHYQAS